MAAERATTAEERVAALERQVSDLTQRLAIVERFLAERFG